MFRTSHTERITLGNMTLPEDEVAAENLILHPYWTQERLRTCRNNENYTVVIAEVGRKTVGVTIFSRDDDGLILWQLRADHHCNIAAAVQEDLLHFVLLRLHPECVMKIRERELPLQYALIACGCRTAPPLSRGFFPDTGEDAFLFERCFQRQELTTETYRPSSLAKRTGELASRIRSRVNDHRRLGRLF